VADEPAKSYREKRGLAPLAWLPKNAWRILHELTRHLLRRPVVSINAVACTDDGRVLLVRRADSGLWALPGGTLEWGEQLSQAIVREVVEETGARWISLGPVTGIYSRPDRDPRFHAVMICVRARVAEPLDGPCNPLEIREARLFAPEAVPEHLAMSMRDMLEDAQRNAAEAVLE